MMHRMVTLSAAALTGWLYGRCGDAFWLPMIAVIGSLWIVEQFYLDRYRPL